MFRFPFSKVIPSGNKDVPSTIVVIGERSILALLDTGFVVFMKKLDFTPICFSAFSTGTFRK